MRAGMPLRLTVGNGGSGEQYYCLSIFHKTATTLKSTLIAAHPERVGLVNLSMRLWLWLIEYDLTLVGFFLGLLKDLRKVKPPEQIEPVLLYISLPEQMKRRRKGSETKLSCRIAENGNEEYARSHCWHIEAAGLDVEMWGVKLMGMK